MIRKKNLIEFFFEVFMYFYDKLDIEISFLCLKRYIYNFELLIGIFFFRRLGISDVF